MVLSVRQIGQKINEVMRSGVEVKANQWKSQQPEWGREIEVKLSEPD